MKRGFTLIELLAVIAIIGILLGIVMTAAANSIKFTRQQKSQAVCKCVKEGLAIYRHQKDQWPGPIGDGEGYRGNDDSGVNGAVIRDRYVLTTEEVRQTIFDLVKETAQKNNGMLDLSALFVTDTNPDGKKNVQGYDFWEAVRGTKRHPQRMSPSSMYFGYPDANTGWFKSLRIVYSVTSDEMEVSAP